MNYFKISIIFVVLIIFNTSYAEVPTKVISGSKTNHIIPPNFQAWSEVKKRNLIKTRIKELMVLDRELGDTLSEINAIGLRILSDICKFKEHSLAEAIQLAESDIRSKKSQLSRTHPKERPALLKAIAISAKVLNQLKINHKKSKVKSLKCK